MRRSAGSTKVAAENSGDDSGRPKFHSVFNRFANRDRLPEELRRLPVGLRKRTNQPQTLIATSCRRDSFQS
jgi:hypothetical protein